MKAPYPIRGKIALLATLIPLCGLLQVQTVHAKENEITTASSFPKMPSVFDRATVQRLLRDIDQDRNDIVLWAGYFVRNGTSQFPGAEGAKMLEDAFLQEQSGSLRWLKFQYVRTFYQGRYVGGAPALRVYADTFDQIETQQKAGLMTLRQSQMAGRLVEQYVNLIPVDWFDRKDKGLKSRLLAQAFRIWLGLPDQDSDADGVKSPRTLHTLDWKRAVKTCGSADVILVVESSLANGSAALRTDARFLLTAAEVLSESQPARAVELLKSAVQCVPRDGKPQTANFEQRLHTVYVDQLEKVGDRDTAVKEQRQFIENKGWGYAKLLGLLSHGERWKEAESVIAELRQPKMLEKNVISSARFLADRARETGDRRYVVWAADILQSYMDSDRVRSVSWELEARAVYIRSLRLQGPSNQAEINQERVKRVDSLLAFDVNKLDPQSPGQRQAYAELQDEQAGVLSWKSTMLPKVEPANRVTAP